jgi:aminoglycoside 3-N-acetyltransferase
VGDGKPFDGSVPPPTRRSLARQLTEVGVRPGSVLLVHSSVKAVGWVVGGPLAVVQALLDALGPAGTLVVPTHTPENSDPAGWSNPPVPQSWWPVIREHMPGFDPAVSPSRWMGVVPELVRRWPGALRSDHPQVSFAAIGPAAASIVGGHEVDDMLGEGSPVGRLYAADGDILLLGVGHGSNSSLHLAEYRVPAPVRGRQGAAVLDPDTGGGRWFWWDDVAVDEGDFQTLGDAFDATGRVRAGSVGAAQCRLMRARHAVDFAVGWMQRHR